MAVIRTLPGGDRLPDDPETLRDYADIRAQAEASLAARVAAYPALVETGRMTAADAEADIAAWRELVSEWRWIETATGDPPSAQTLFDRLAAVDLALERIDALLGRNPHNPERRRRRDLLIAMRWHLSRLDRGEPAIHGATRLTQLLRAPCPVCDRRRGDPVVNACTRTDCGLPGRASPLPSERTAA